MAQGGFSAFLLFLGLVVSCVFGNNVSNLCENILSANVSNASLSGFNLTVSPAHLLSNTTYTVNVNGNGNFTVLLQAVTLSGSVGNWSQGTNNSCNGSALFIDYFTSSNLLNTTWTSPDNATHVTIKAYIHNETTTFLLQQALSRDTNKTTEAPATANSTANSTISSAAPTTASHTDISKPSGAGATSTHHVVQTTSAGSIDLSSLISVALSVFLSLLLIPNKHLS